MVWFGGLGVWGWERERERKQAGRGGWDEYGRGKGAALRVGNWEKEKEAARGVVPRRVRCSWLGKWGSNCFSNFPWDTYGGDGWAWRR